MLVLPISRIFATHSHECDENLEQSDPQNYLKSCLKDKGDYVKEFNFAVIQCINHLKPFIGRSAKKILVPGSDAQGTDTYLLGRTIKYGDSEGLVTFSKNQSFFHPLPTSVPEKKKNGTIIKEYKVNLQKLPKNVGPYVHFSTRRTKDAKRPAHVEGFLHHKTPPKGSTYKSSSKIIPPVLYQKVLSNALIYDLDLWLRRLDHFVEKSPTAKQTFDRNEANVKAMIRLHKNYEEKVKIFCDYLSDDSNDFSKEITSTLKDFVKNNKVPTLPPPPTGKARSQ